MTQRHLWLIDAGHAPSTPGKRSPVTPPGDQLLEWEFARDVAQRLRARLDERGIANHILTPHQEADIKPSARAAMANAIPGRTRLVSIHSNAAGSSGWSDASGIAALHYTGSAVSQAMAEVFQRHLVHVMGWRDRGLKPRGNLSLLKRTRMPAVITETGFYTNRHECSVLLQPSARCRIAEAHAGAIQEIEGVGS